jgi:hypothetical protein
MLISDRHITNQNIKTQEKPKDDKDSFVTKDTLTFGTAARESNDFKPLKGTFRPLDDNIFKSQRNGYISNSSGISIYPLGKTPALRQGIGQVAAKKHCHLSNNII